MQFIPYDKIISSKTNQGLKEFISQPAATQAKKGGKLVSRMPAIEKTSDFLGFDGVQLSTESEP